MVYCKRVLSLLLVFLILFIFSWQTIVFAALDSFVWHFSSRGGYSDNVVIQSDSDISISFPSYPVVLDNRSYTFDICFVDSDNNDLNFISIVSKDTVITYSDILTNAVAFYLSVDSNSIPGNIQAATLLNEYFANNVVTYEFIKSYLDYSQYIRISYRDNYNVYGDIPSDLTFSLPKNDNFNGNYMILKNSNNNYVLLSPYLLNSSNYVFTLFTSSNGIIDEDNQVFSGGAYFYECSDDVYFVGNAVNKFIYSDSFDTPVSNIQYQKRLYVDVFNWDNNTSEWKFSLFDYMLTYNSSWQVIASNIRFYIGDNFKSSIFKAKGDIFPVVRNDITSMSEFTFSTLVLDDRGIWLGNNFSNLSTYSFKLVFLFDNSNTINVAGVGNIVVPLKYAQVFSSGRNSFSDFSSTESFSFFMISTVTSSINRDIITYYGNPPLSGVLHLMYVLWDLNDNSHSKYFLVQSYNMNVSQALIDHFNELRGSYAKQINDYLRGGTESNWALNLWEGFRRYIDSAFLSVTSLGDYTGIERIFEKIRSVFVEGIADDLNFTLFGTTITIPSDINKNYPSELVSILNFLWIASISLYIITDMRNRVDTILEGEFLQVGHDIKKEVL